MILIIARSHNGTGVEFIWRRVCFYWLEIFNVIILKSLFCKISTNLLSTEMYIGHEKFPNQHIAEPSELVLTTDS